LLPKTPKPRPNKYLNVSGVLLKFFLCQQKQHVAQRSDRDSQIPHD